MLHIKNFFFFLFFSTLLIIGAGCTSSQKASVGTLRNDTVQNTSNTPKKIRENYANFIYGFSFKNSEGIRGISSDLNEISANNPIPLSDKNQTGQLFSSPPSTFATDYPNGLIESPKGPNQAENDFRTHRMIQGMAVPLFDQFFYKRNQEDIFTIHIPDFKNFTWVTGDYEWDKHVCGNEEFATIASSERIMLGGKKALKVVSTENESGRQSVYYCVNNPTYPLIIIVPIEHQSEVEKIITTLSFDITKDLSNIPLINNTIPFTALVTDYELVNSFSPYKEVKFFNPIRLPLNNDCVHMIVSSTGSSYGNHWDVRAEAQCSHLGTLFISSEKKIKAEVLPVKDSFIYEVTAHFMNNDRPAAIPDLKIRTVPFDLDKHIGISYLDQNAVYVEYGSYGGKSSYYYFDGKTWQWLDLYQLVKSELKAPHQVFLHMNVSEKYLHISEGSFVDQNETTLELFKKGVHRQHFILDRKTLKILWSGTVFEQAGV